MRVLIGAFGTRGDVQPMLAVAQALIARGLAGQIKVVSFDKTPALVELLDQGAVQALIAQKPERMGALAVEMLLQKVRGGAIAPLVDTGVDVVRPSTKIASPQ